MNPRKVANKKVLDFIPKTPGTILPNVIGRRGNSFKERSQINGPLLKLVVIDSMKGLDFLDRYSNKKPLLAKKTTQQPRTPESKHNKTASQPNKAPPSIDRTESTGSEKAVARKNTIKKIKDEYKKFSVLISLSSE